MTGKTHVGVGVISTVILSEYFKYNLTIGVVFVSALASLLPDVDHPKSIINQYVLPMKRKEFKIAVYVVLGVFLIILNYFYFNNAYLTTAGILLIMIGVSTHREGITHSLAGFICFSASFGYLAVTYKFQELIIPFAIGYGMHLIGDMFTNRGVPLLFPFKKKKFKMPITYSVGSWWGDLLEGIIIAWGLIYLIFKLPMIITRIK